jgi:integrase
MKLTRTSVEKLTPTQKDYIEWDSEMKGFGVRVWPSGTKTWVCQYRAGGRTRRVKLGVYPNVEPDLARQLAQVIFGDVAQGRDPARDKAAYKVGESFREVAETWYAQAELKPKTRETYDIWLKRDIVPEFGAMKVNSITSKDVKLFHAKVHNSGRQVAAKRMLSIVRNVLGYALEFELVERNVARDVKAPKGVDRARLEWMTDEEVARFLDATDAMRAGGGPEASMGAFFQLMFFTGARPGELRALTWDRVRLDDRIIRLYPEDQKGSHNKPIKLGEDDNSAQMQILRSLPRTDPKWVFPGRKKGKHILRTDGMFDRIKERAKLNPNYTQRILRDTHGVLTRRFFSLDDTQRSMRHSRSSTTEAHYAPIGEERAGVVAQALPDLIRELAIKPDSEAPTPLRRVK